MGKASSDGWLRLGLQRSEAGRVAVMLVYSAASTGGVLTVGIIVSSTLFLSRLPASATPYLFILPAISIIPALLVYNRLAARFRLERVVAGSIGLLLAGVVAFRLLLATPLGDAFLTLAALYLWIEVTYTVVLLQFWSLAGQVFNAREAKRLFALIAVGGTLAKILAGLSTATISQWIGVPNLMWVVAGALAVCLACAQWARRWLPQAGPASAIPTGPSPGLIQDLRLIARSPLLRGLGALTVLVALLINTGWFLFFLNVQTVFAGQGEAMAAYQGALEFWAGWAALGVQLVLSGLIMNRFGVVAALLVLPLSVMLAGTLGLATGGALWALTVLVAVDPVLRRTLNSAALNVLYLPVPTRLRERAKELFEVIYAAAFGLAGVAFLVLQAVPTWQPLYYAFPLLGLAAVWLGVVAGLRVHYRQALAEGLKRRALDLAAETIAISDDTTVQVLAAALRDPAAPRILHGLQLIASAPAVDWDARVAPLLRHPSPEVRCAALRHLGRPGQAAYAEAIGALLDAPETSVRAAAITALCVSAGPVARARIEPFLHEPDPAVRGAALVGLLLHSDLDGVAAAVAALQRMVASAEPADRREAARVIGVIQSPAFYTPLQMLLEDARPEVRLSAVRAAGALRRPELVAPLLRRLADRAVAPAVIDALARYGGGIELQLGPALAAAGPRAGLPGLLARLRTEAATQLLVAHFRSDDVDLRGEVVRALAELRAGGLTVALEGAAVRAAFAGELREAYAWIVAHADLSAVDAGGLLAEACRLRLERTLDRLFDLLRLLYPRYQSQLQRARRAVAQAPTPTRALAIELLDNLAERALTEPLLPLIEGPLEKQLETAQRRFGLARRPAAERLAEWAGGADLWLRVCALYHIGRLRLEAQTAPVVAALRAEAPLVRETALAACRSLLGPERAAALTAAPTPEPPRPAAASL